MIKEHKRPLRPLRKGPDMKSVGQIIAENRKRCGLSQVELAKLLQKEGFTQTQKAVSKWEKNDTEPSVTIFFAICQLLGVTNLYEAYYGINPDDPLSSLNDAGKEKALDYISLLHDSGKYEKKVCEVLPFLREIPVFENAVSAGTGNFLEDSANETVRIDRALLPENTSFGVHITGDSMEPNFHDGQIAWVSQQESVEDGEIGIFSLNGDAYIKKLQNNNDGLFLISLNKNYAPIPVGENDRLDIFGKVVGTCDENDLQ